MIRLVRVLADGLRKIGRWRAKRAKLARDREKLAGKVWEDVGRSATAAGGGEVVEPGEDLLMPQYNNELKTADALLVDFVEEGEKSGEGGEKSGEAGPPEGTSAPVGGSSSSPKTPTRTKSCFPSLSL